LAAVMMAAGVDVAQTYDALVASGEVKDVVRVDTDSSTGVKKPRRYACVTPAICGAADPMAGLRAAAAQLKLRKDRARVVEAIASGGGRVKVADLVALCGWDHAASWNSVRCGLNKRLKPLGWSLGTEDHHAIARRVEPKKRAQRERKLNAK
jgi:hypothetical protein